MSALSTIVSEGMKRVCADFDRTADRFGFVQAKARLWVRLAPLCAETMHLERRGSSYGAPRTASVDIRITLAICVLNDPAGGSGVFQRSDPVRRENGYAYHHRFNAETWSTYDRCVEELGLFVIEYAEPWFAHWREPANLIGDPELSQPARERFAEALAGREDASSVLSTLKRLGLTGRKLAKATTNLAPS